MDHSSPHALARSYPCLVLSTVVRPCHADDGGAVTAPTDVCVGAAPSPRRRSPYQPGGHATGTSTTPGGSDGGQRMDPYGQGPAGAFRDEKEWAVMRARQNPSFPATHRSMPPSLFYFSSPQQMTAVQASHLVLPALALRTSTPIHRTHNSHVHQHHTPHTSTVVFPPGEAVTSIRLF